MEEKRGVLMKNDKLSVPISDQHYMLDFLGVTKQKLCKYAPELFKPVRYNCVFSRKEKK